MESSSISSALYVQGIVSHIIGFLPWKQQVYCRLVSKTWCLAVDEERNEPIALHVQDKDALLTWRFPEQYRLTGKEWKEKSFPLWRLPSIPNSIASRVVKLTLVANFSSQYEDCYDLCDYQSINGTHNLLLQRFTSLEDLTILSDYNIAATMFFRNENFLFSSQWHNVWKSSAPFPLSLKRLVYYETSMSTPRPYSLEVWRPADIRHLVTLVPNLEELECPTNAAVGGTLADFLPLAATLRRLNLRDCVNVVNSAESCDSLIKQFPKLEAWDFSGTSMMPEPTVSFVVQKNLLLNETAEDLPLDPNTDDIVYKTELQMSKFSGIKVLNKYKSGLREKYVTAIDRDVAGGDPSKWTMKQSPNWNDRIVHEELIYISKVLVALMLHKRQIMLVGDWSCVTYDHLRRESLRFHSVICHSPWGPFPSEQIKQAARAMKRRRRWRKLRSATRTAIQTSAHYLKLTCLASIPRTLFSFAATPPDKQKSSRPSREDPNYWLVQTPIRRRGGLRFLGSR